MDTPNTFQNDDEIKAQAQVWKHMFGFAETIMLRSTVSLGIPDIIHNNGPVTLSQLVTHLPLKSTSIDRFHHFMRYLVHMQLFTISTDQITKEDKYELTPASKLLVHGHQKSLAPYVMLQTHPEEFSVWSHVINVLDGKKPYWESNDTSMYEKTEGDPEINEILNDAMTSHSTFMLPALVSGLMKENVLDGVASIVDVGGNSGVVAKGIVDAFPHVKCSVMDLNHVIERVIKNPKLDYVAGDMFTSIPNADAILLKSTLHNYEDDDCIKILNIAKEALPSTGGKVILVEIVVDTENLPLFTSARLSMGMDMMLMSGKERTKKEWEDLLRKANFTSHQVIPIMAIESIIVAYS
uniref:Columbamine O-methyltransferase n=1 Tax=Coptis japonica TaxID=3442 RepID=COOMT_COPJA|nr:RecName: Full=Columbamine O-methyltransferase; Short=CoOMT; AltName: Full=Tetrahydrocolumbamine 2-O-methyltransferase [Coptis japonica]BAC22084.1 columbamine O-methyltransferase [Coptis japonica]